jgi:predicted ATPase/DNA-binding winged helix-turn-helix (wHTH) protein
MIYVFDECLFDVDAYELRRDGEAVHVEPQVLDVLRYLVENADRVVSKAELLDNIWGDRFVSETALTSRIKAARRAVGDDGRAQRVIRTVHARGYRFVATLDDHVGAPPVPAGGGRGAGPEDVASAMDVGGRGTVGDRAGTVPIPATPTIGRANEVEQVAEVLTDARIVTLLGPGGVGKTRVATEVARAWPTEAYFVDLTRVREAELVPELIVRDLGIHAATGADARSVLNEALRGRSLLLVLDNFEHVIGASPIVGELVRWGSDVRVLVTSRARLRVAGERVVDVAPLSADCNRDHEKVADAVALFDQAAVAVDPSFRLSAHLDEVELICRAVDGLPLAIELAAGHVRTLPPSLLRARLGARLESASVALRDAPERQHTISATIDWSLQLLHPAERRVFVRLGVFDGAVPLDAVERVCGEPGVDVVDLLTRLVDQSLVRRVVGARDEPRFSLLVLLRERARQILDGDERMVLADRHAEYVVDFLDELDDRRWTVASDRWIDLITEQLAEIRAAHAWALGRDKITAARIAAGLGTYWHREGHHVEGRQWIAAALSDADELTEDVSARLHLAAGFVEWPYDEVKARAHWERAVDAFRRQRDDRRLAYTLALSAGTYIGDDAMYEHAMARCDEGVALARIVGDRPLIAQALNVKGELTRVHGDDTQALAAYEEGRDLAIAAGDEAHLTAFLANLGYLADHRGDVAEARALGCEALRRCRTLGRRMMAAWTVSELAGPELRLGRPERGATLVGAADEALRVLGVARHPGDRPEHRRVVSALRGVLGDETFAARYAEGARIPLDDAITLALSEPDIDHV